MKDKKQKSGFSFRKLAGLFTGQKTSAPETRSPAASVPSKKPNPFTPEKKPAHAQDSQEKGLFSSMVTSAKRMWPWGTGSEEASAPQGGTSGEFGSVAYEESRPIVSAPQSPSVVATQPSNAMPTHMAFPLQPIVDSLPENLKALAKGQAIGTVNLNAQTLLKQLSSGSVRVSFGELRSNSSGAFANNPQFDSELVDIPLEQVIAKVGHFLPARRPKKRIAVPEDIADAFTIPKNPRPLPAPSSPAAQPSGPRAAPAPVSKTATPASTGPAPVIPFPSAKPQPAAPASQKAPVAPAKQAAPPASTQPAPVIPFPATKAQPASPAPAPKPAPAQAAVKLPAPPPAAPKEAQKPEVTLPKQETTAPVAAAPQPAVTTASLTETAFIIGVGEVCQAWPEPVMHELETARLRNSSVALPLDRLEVALKTGRIVFTWGEICKWMQPAWEAETTNESTELELPLEVVAPLFMAQKRAAGKTRKKVALDQTIPDVFAAQRKAAAATAAPQAPVVAIPSAAPAFAPQPAAAPIALPVTPAPQPVAVPAAPAPKPAPTPVPAPPTPVPVDPDLAVISDAVGLLSKGEWALQELADQSIKLKGIGGILIATLDGFMVASATAPQWKDEMIAGMAPDVQGEVLAALFPQLFTKLNEYFKDLEFGQMTNMRLTVGNLNFAVYKAGDLFFAALGRSGEKLPESGLEAISAALAKRPI